MRSVLQELLTCPRAHCRNTELCYGVVWLVFAPSKVLAVLRSTKIVPPCTTQQAGSEQYSRVWTLWRCSLERLVSSWPIPIFPHPWLGLEHSVHRKAGCWVWRILEQGRLGVCSCLCHGISYCEHLQVMFVTSEMLPGTQQRRVYPSWALHSVLSSFPPTAGQTILQFHRKTRRTVLCLWRSSREEAAERTAPRWVMKRGSLLVSVQPSASLWWGWGLLERAWAPLQLLQ